MIDDMVPSIRDVLGVTASYDETTIAPGIRRAIVFMLRTWNFPQALQHSVFPLADGDKEVALPTSGLGHIVTVRLGFDNGSAEPVFRHLRKTETGRLKRQNGPFEYWLEHNKLVLDTPVPSDNYYVELWYQTTDPAVAEPWITSDFEDVLHVLASMRLATELRKPEVQQQMQQAWSELVPTLAQYLNEVKYSDMDLRLVPPAPVDTARYPAS